MEIHTNSRLTFVPAEEVAMATAADGLASPQVYSRTT